MAKDVTKNEAKATKKDEKMKKEKVVKPKTTTKKATSAKTKAEAKKTVTKKGETKSTKKETVKKEPKAKKATITKKTTETKVATTKTKTASKTSTAKKKTTPTKAKAKIETSSKSTAKPMLAEYYDLPYRYNQTIVKILAQTPTTLFVYWDISDEDRNSLINLHGENFFSETRPVLVVHNITHNYTFEIEINDFANSWYIRTGEPNSDYIIELGRRSNINNNEYIYINSSNEMASPNDHILFENIDLGNVLFKNVKTSKHAFKDFGDLKFINDIDKLYGNIYDVYSALYDDELLNELTNPSSGEFYLKK